jgi:hypothetical protein
MNEIEINGNTFKFSRVDYKFVCGFRLYVDGDGYLRKRGSAKANPETRIHRLIAERMGYNTHDALVDHKDRIRSNNRRTNIRLVNAQESALNRKAVEGVTSKYRGVGYRKDRGTWRARLYIRGKEINIGHYATEHEAHIAFGAAARIHPEYHGTQIRIVD